MTDDGDDPLEHAAVGERHTITKEIEFEGINYEPNIYYGSDRESDVRISDVEIIHRDNGLDNFKVTWQGEVMKTLPSRWDYSRVPLTESEKQAEKKRNWLRHLGRLLSLIVPLFVTFWVASHVMNTLANELTINGTTVSPPGTVEWLGVAGLFAVATLMMYIGFEKGGFPGKAGMRR